MRIYLRMLCLAAALGMAACLGSESKEEVKDNSNVKEKKVGDAVLKIEDLKVGEGKEAKAGDVVEVHYTGWLTNGKKFDSSVGQKPLQFKLGAKKVIQGWDEGVAGMKVGGKRKLTIPPELAYGAAGAGDDIPPNATLVFEVELLKIK
jgi:FKBP-type peptidyl-prolyl cis-trans isomerase